MVLRLSKEGRGVVVLVLSFVTSLPDVASSPEIGGVKRGTSADTTSPGAAVDVVTTSVTSFPP